MLSTAKAGPTRAPLCRIAIAMVAALLAWPAVVQAEPGGDAPSVSALGDADSNAEPPVAAPLRPVPKLTLRYPGGSAVVLNRGSFEAATLSLDMPSYPFTSDVPLVSQSDQARRRPLSWELSTEPRMSPFWPAFGNGATTITRRLARPLTLQDDRSAWARWHSSLWGVSATVGVAMIATVATLSLLPKQTTSWNKPEFHGLKSNFTTGPSFDFDNFYFNYIAHPYDGSEFYLIARNRKFTWWQSLLYAAAVSTTFEFLIESAYEGASWQDLWITPVSGAVIGELRWQAKKALEDPQTGKPVGTVNKILHVVVDPVDAVLNL